MLSLEVSTRFATLAPVDANATRISWVKHVTNAKMGSTTTLTAKYVPVMYLDPSVPLVTLSTGNVCVWITLEDVNVTNVLLILSTSLAVRNAVVTHVVLSMLFLESVWPSPL